MNYSTNLNSPLGANERPVIYSTGYTGQNINALLPLLARLEAVLVDVRLSPRSRVPHWQGSALADLCGTDNYLHLAEFGNLNYRSGDANRIEIAEFEQGFIKLERLLNQRRSAVLLCACEKAVFCHRRVLSERLNALGYPVAEIGAWKDKTNLLFT